MIRAARLRYHSPSRRLISKYSEPFQFFPVNGFDGEDIVADVDDDDASIRLSVSCIWTEMAEMNTYAVCTPRL
ncbi:MAG: hypothetical protein MJZ72_05560 [Bacteroidales bacterium]|nr:hypothetical protein [Bacteroidales bacterium]